MGRFYSFLLALPEYPIVMDMNGVEATLGPQLIAEIGDVTRFTHREALTAFAGVDPEKNDSEKRIQNSARTSKKGSPYLRKALFQIMDSLIKRSPVVLFMLLWIKNDLKANLIMFT